MLVTYELTCYWLGGTLLPFVSISLDFYFMGYFSATVIHFYFSGPKHSVGHYKTHVLCAHDSSRFQQPWLRGQACWHRGEWRHLHVTTRVPRRPNRSVSRLPGHCLQRKRASPHLPCCNGLPGPSAFLSLTLLCSQDLGPRKINPEPEAVEILDPGFSVADLGWEHGFHSGAPEGGAQAGQREEQLEEGTQDPHMQESWGKEMETEPGGKGGGVCGRGRGTEA